MTHDALHPLHRSNAGALRAERSDTPPLSDRSLRTLVAAAIALGVLGQVLFYAESLGVNLVLGTGAALVAARLARRPGTRMHTADLWIPIAALAFAAMVALRSDPALVVFDTLATVALTGASMVALAGVEVTRRSVTAIARLGFGFTAAALGGAARLARPVTRWSRIAASGMDAAALSVVRGVVLAVPVVVVFAVLFASADAVFARLAVELLAPRVDMWDATARVLFAIGLAWLAAGSLLFAAWPVRWTSPLRTSDAPAPESAAAVAHGPAVSTARLGTVEALVVLVSVDVLFAIFVGLQATYLFGGRETLDAAGMTYSEYARRGFFELIGVAVVAGTLLLGLEATVARRTRRYVAAAVVLAALTGLVLASAALRLALYQAAYGWTELRFYAGAAIVWLAICVALATAAIALGRARWLPHGAVLSALAIALAVNAIGPQAYVAAQNVERALHPGLVAEGGRSGLDEAYLAELGDDAVPVLLDALPSLPRADAVDVRRLLRSRLRALDRQPRGESWPSWNLGRERARSLLEDARGALVAP